MLDINETASLFDLKGIPKLFCWNCVTISKNAVHLREENVEKSRSLNHSPNGIMDHTRGFIERAHLDAGAATHPILCPE